MRKVACVGILVADVIVSPVAKLPDKGMLDHVNSITVHNGGNAMTASINLKTMGVETAIVGRIGTDMFGDYLRGVLDRKGVNTSALKSSEESQTSASVVTVDETGERSFLHCVGANADFCIDDIDMSVIEDYDSVFVTGSFLLKTFDGKQTMEFLKKCQEMNAPISDIMKLRETTAGSLSIEEVDAKLQTIMVNICHNMANAAEKYGAKGNYVVGANIAGFEKVAEAMIAQGI